MNLLKILQTRLDTNKLFAVQNSQNVEALYMTGSVPASGTILLKTTVSNKGHFWCTHVTGSYTTASNAQTDDGICHLKGKLMDGGTSRPIFNDYVPLNLWLTPGRVMSIAGSGSASNNLFIPMVLDYLFSANTDIQLDCTNDVAYAQTVNIIFWGVRVNIGGR